MQLKPNAILQGGKYRIVRTLGQGGFGITYEVEQALLRRRVAVKEFFMMYCCERCNDNLTVTIGTGAQRDLVNKFRAKFIKEASTIASFNHDYIVQVLDAFEENGTAYYVMEFLPGGSLANMLSQSGPLSENRALVYIQQVASALEYIHEHHTVHLDVKPSNILLNAQGDAVLIDFGTSKHYDSAGDQTSTTPVGYSKGYAPLEQYRDGDVSQFKATTDIYALGATLYSLVTGVVPPEASDVFENGLNRIGGISDAVWEAITKAMKPQRRDRPQSIREFLSLFGEDGTIVNQSPESKDHQQMEEAEGDNSFEYLGNDGSIRVYHGHGKKWLAIGEEQISEYYDDVFVESLVDNCIICTKCDGYYAYTYIDVVNKTVESTPHKYLYANALKGIQRQYRDASIWGLINKPNNYYNAIIQNSSKDSLFLVMLRRYSNSYVIDEQGFDYHPQTKDDQEYRILLLVSILGFPIAGLTAAGCFHFNLIIGAILGLLLGIVYTLANKKDCVEEAYVNAVGPCSTVLGAKTITTEIRDPISDSRWPSPTSPSRIQRRNLDMVKAKVYQMNDAPSYDSVNVIVCSQTDAQGYYRIERNGIIGMRHITDNGIVQELFPFDGEDDLDFEDAWLRLQISNDI